MSSDTFKLFLTPEHKCSYLAERTARSAFLDPAVTITPELYASLNRQGFRRSGKFLYKPRCESCAACISARILTSRFKKNRSQKRIMKRNSHLVARRLNTISSESIYSLYERYINTRHSDGDMYPPTREQYRSFLVERLSSTFYVGFYDDITLVAVSVIDYVQDGLSALYTFYDPDLPRQALGVHAILWQIEECQRLDLPYLYMGYWINDCQKMSYKTHYQPQEHLMGEEWVRLPEKIPTVSKG